MHQVYLTSTMVFWADIESSHRFAVELMVYAISQNIWLLSKSAVTWLENQNISYRIGVERQYQEYSESLYLEFGSSGPVMVQALCDVAVPLARPYVEFDDINTAILFKLSC